MGIHDLKGFIYSLLDDRDEDVQNAAEKNLSTFLE